MVLRHQGALTVGTLGSLLMSLLLLRLARVVVDGKEGRDSVGSIMLGRLVGVLEAVWAHNSSCRSRIIRRRRMLRRWRISSTGHNPRLCFDCLPYLSTTYLCSLLPCSGRRGEKTMIYHTYLSDLYLGVAVDDSLLSYYFTFLRLFSSCFHAIRRSNTLTLAYEPTAWFTVDIAPPPCFSFSLATLRIYASMSHHLRLLCSAFLFSDLDLILSWTAYLLLFSCSILRFLRRIRPPYSLLSLFCCPLSLAASPSLFFFSPCSFDFIFVCGIRVVSLVPFC